MLHAYAAFGLRLDSALAFPELPPSAGELCRVRLERSTAANRPAVPGLTRVGAASYAGDAALELWRAGDRWRLTTSDAGSWDIVPDESRLVWYSAPDVREAIARYDALGRVIPLLLHARGALCVHGSAVAVDGLGAAFVGARGRGKSTLALALMAEGAVLAGDDVAPLWPGTADGAARLGPGAPCARVWPDSATALEVAGPSLALPDEPVAKRLVAAIPAERRLTREVPLGGIYLLESVAPEGAVAAADRTPITGARAALALVAHATSARLLAADGGADLVDRAALLAARVPIWRLRVTRDLARLNEAARTIGGWVRESGASAGAAAVRGAA